MKLSISLKLLIGLSLLIFGMTSSIAYLNSEYLKKMILQRERDFNLSLTEAKAKQIDTYFDQQINSYTLLAQELLKQQSTNQITNQNNEAELFRNTQDLVSLEVIEVNNLEQQTVLLPHSKVQYKKPDWNYSANETKITQGNKSKLDLLIQIKKKPNQAIISNSTGLFNVSEINKQHSIITIAIPYSSLNKELFEVILVYIKTDTLDKLFSNTKLGSLKLFNEGGFAIAGSDESISEKIKNISKTELFNFIKNYPLLNYSGLDEGSLNPTPNADKKSTLLSFSKTERGLFLLSEIPVETLLAPAQLISFFTFRLSGLFLAGSLFFVFIFSSSITRPLGKLAEISLDVAKGNFENNSNNKLKFFFKDEVYTLSVAVDRMVKGLKERNRFKTLFDKFHGSAVTEDLMKNEIALRGEKKQMYVFFSDLRGFTNMSEAKDPTLVVKMLNEYFSYMVPVINQSGGVVDKFIGDAIMAVWGVPQEKPDDGKNALLACLKMRLSLATLNGLRKQRGEPELWMGMALHFGEAISGTIGSFERMEYTVIGNTINTASRIEASTKTFGTDFLVSEEVKNKHPDFIYEEAGTVEVKGRSENLKLFKVLGYMSKNGTKVDVQTIYSSYAAEAGDKVKLVS